MSSLIVPEPENRISAQEVVDFARENLRNRQGVSIIRLGDGEGRLMGFPRVCGMNTLSDSLVYWFGRTDIPLRLLMLMKLDLLEAVVCADVIGLATRDQVRGNPEFRRPWRVMYEDLAIWPDPRGKMDPYQICDKALHRQLHDEGLFDVLFEGLRTVHLITCRDVGQAFEERFGVRVEGFLIPEEGQMALKRGETPEEHFPVRFDNIRSEILSQPRQGELWLVGAGVLGKAYCHSIKAAGGVAVDIGSIFDGWAGVSSRSYLYSVDEYRL